MNRYSLGEFISQLLEQYEDPNTCVCAQFLSPVWLFATLSTVAWPGSSVHGISWARILGVGCHLLLQGIFLIQGLNPCHCISSIAGGFFTAEPLGKLGKPPVILILVNCNFMTIELSMVNIQQKPNLPLTSSPTTEKLPTRKMQLGAAEMMETSV